MIILKRTLVWLVERLLEAGMLGALFTVLINQNSDVALRSGYGNLFADVWVFGVVVAVLLFVHGYYITTAITGVFWRSKKPWVYATTTAILFALHTHIIFLRGKPDFTREAKLMELPLVVGGLLIVFMCSFAGSEAFKRWTGIHRSSNPYLSASVLTLFAFLLLNIANYLRPVAGNLSFRAYGLPFSFYRDGGYVDGWIWRSSVLLWRGLLADAVVVAAVIALVGSVAQRIRRPSIS